MNKLALILLISTFFMSLSKSQTIGSCQKQSLDGQKCQQCIQSYHLHEGNCFVDILGCSEYMFGNICHECDPGYILVNNLCCDHNCMARLFSRASSDKLQQQLNQNFDSLSLVIPFINVNYIKGQVNVMLEIQTRTYIDVIRFVILYELPGSKHRFRRAIVDYVPKTKEVIGVDWSIIADSDRLMQFHHEEIVIKDNEEAEKIIANNFDSLTAVVLKVANYTDIKQYEIVLNNEQQQEIIFQTFYIHNSTKLTLINSSKPMPDFLPSEIRINAQNIETQAQISEHFSSALEFVKKDDRYAPSIDHVIVKHKVRYVIEYVFYIDNENQEIWYYVVQNLKNGNLKIIDLKWVIKNKETEQQVKNETTVEEEKVDEIVEGAIETVKQDKQEEEVLGDCQGVDCTEREKVSSELEKEEMKIIAIFRQHNPNVGSFEIVQQWVHDFRTFSEWTLLIRVKTSTTSLYYFFHVLLFKNDSSIVFWGQKEVSEPQKDESGHYVLDNRQSNVAESQTSVAKKIINEEFNQTVNAPLAKALLRESPEGRNRFVIIYRLHTSTVRFIVLQNATNVWIQENETLEEGLEPLTPEIETVIEVQQKTQVIIDQVSTGHQIDPEVDLTNSSTITIPSNPQPKDEKDEEHEEMVGKIIDDLLLSNDKSEVLTETPKNITILIENHQIYKSWTIVIIWINRNFQTYQEYTILLQKNNQYVYLHIFQWIKTYQMVIVGTQNVTKPYVNNKGDYVILNPEQKDLENKNKQQIVSQIIKTLNHTEDLKVQTLIVRTFPTLTRYIIIIIIHNQEIRYVIHQKENSFIIIQSTILRDNVNSGKEEIIEEIVQTVIEEVGKDLEDEKVIQDCTGVDCVEREKVSSELEKEETRIIAIFRQHNLNISSFEIVQQWVHDFRTFSEWTLLIRVKASTTSLYYFFHVLLFKNDSSIVFWGQKEVSEPQKDESGHYVLDNRQSNVAESQTSVAKKIINEEFNQTVNAPLAKALLRESPEGRNRFVIIYRLYTSTVRFIVLQNSTNVWIQENETLEEGLEPLTPEIETVIEVQQELEVITQQTIEGQNKTEITYPNITITIPVPEITDNQTNQSTIHIESPSEGNKTQNIHVLTDSEKIIIERIINFITKVQPTIVTQEQVSIITNQIPMTFIEQQFCDTADFTLVYQVNKIIYVFAFRASVLHPEKLQFLGTFTFPKSSLTLSQVLKKSTDPKIDFSQAQALSLILQSHPELPANMTLTPQSVTLTQVGQTLRATIMINLNGFYTRFVIGLKNSSTYEIVQQCRLQSNSSNSTTEVLPQIEEPNLGNQTVVIDPNEIEEIIKEVIEQAKEPTTPSTTEPTTPSTTGPTNTTINPSDIQEVIEQIFNTSNPNHNQSPEEPILVTKPHLSFSREEALDYLYGQKPQVQNTKVISESKQELPNIIKVDFIFENGDKKYHTIVTKNNESVITLVSFTEINEPKNGTLETIIQDLQEEDKENYTPITVQNPDIQQAIQIVNTNSTPGHNLTNPSDDDKDLVQFIREEVPIVRDGEVIRIADGNEGEKIVYFYIGNGTNNDSEYTVVEVRVKDGQIITVIEVVHNGTKIEVVLQNNTHLDKQVNIAYGYETVDLKEALGQPEIQEIIAQITKKYPQFTNNDNILEIQQLELKNNKTNYIFRYTNSYFTIFYDLVLKKVVFLNQVSTTSRTELKAITKPTDFNKGIQYFASLHEELKEYKIISSGEFTDGDWDVFSAEVIASGKKFRIIFKINSKTGEKAQITFTQLLEVSLSQPKIQPFVLTYQQIPQQQYSNNQYLSLVIKFIKTKNQVLKSSQVLSASYKAQNLGFSYKITLLNENAEIYEIQVYVETFSQKFTQISFRKLDFESGLSLVKMEDKQAEGVIEQIKNKAGITGNCISQTLEAKDFLSGTLFKLTASLNSTAYSGLAFVSASDSLSLLDWSPHSETPCKTPSAKLDQCLQCNLGWISTSNGTNCTREIHGCSTYGEDKLTCSVCKAGYVKINGICTKDCGPLCSTVSFP